jgi:DNA-binding NarL/FixJ family response regulator
VRARLFGDAQDVRCLIVDDSPNVLAVVRGLLERAGISVVGVASTSAEAVRLAKELRPDVTLIDVDLGDESGLELARRLERDDPKARSRSILISAHAEDDLADLIEASPAAGFVAKTDLSAEAIYAILSGSPGT